jgi:hypothetical protein
MSRRRRSRRSGSGNSQKPKPNVIEIKPSGKNYDIVVPLRLSRENEWLKWGAILGSIFDALSDPRPIISHKKLYDSITKLPDDLNLGGRKLKRELMELVKAYEELKKRNDPFVKQIFEKATFQLKFVDIKESWGNVSYTIFMQYESDEVHPLQFFFYITMANPKASFFASLIFLRTYDFSKYSKEYTYQFKYAFNKRIIITKGAKNEQEARNLALKMLFKPAYVVDMQPKISVQRTKKGWEVKVDEVIYTVKMRYIDGTISDNVLSQVGELLPALPPHQVVKINNINGTELLKESIEPADVQLISPSRADKQENKPTQENKPITEQSSPDKPSIQPVGSGTPLSNNPTPWFALAGVGLVGWLLMNKKRR